MRPSCIECCAKHIGQAAVLLCEVNKGYPYHLIYAIGHLAEAEDETVHEFPKIAEKIREFRIALMDGEDVNLDSLIEFIYNWRKSNV